jgi:hypothetical protein
MLAELCPDLNMQSPEGAERVLAAFVLLADGDSQELLSAAALALRDWRDVLMGAGLANENWRNRLAEMLGPA